MAKQTKNSINRESVKKELLFYNTAHIRYSIVFLASISILMVPLTVLYIHASIKTVPASAVGMILLSVLITLLLCSPMVITILVLIHTLFERKRIHGDAFEILCLPLSYKTERIDRRHVKLVLGFENLKETSVNSTIFQLSSSGDEFYLVCFERKNAIQLLYPTKMYELRDEANNSKR